jgi:hypothetical protein
MTMMEMYSLILLLKVSKALYDYDGDVVWFCCSRLIKLFMTMMEMYSLILLLKVSKALYDYDGDVQSDSVAQG